MQNPGGTDPGARCGLATGPLGTRQPVGFILGIIVGIVLGVILLLWLVFDLIF